MSRNKTRNKEKHRKRWKEEKKKHHDDGHKNSSKEKAKQSSETYGPLRLNSSHFKGSNRSTSKAPIIEPRIDSGFPGNNHKKSVSHNDEERISNEVTEGSLSIGSRKRKLARIEFVKPSVNGISEAFTFESIKKVDDFSGKQIHPLDTKGKSVSGNNVLPNKKQSIDDILFSKIARSTDKNEADNCVKVLPVVRMTHQESSQPFLDVKIGMKRNDMTNPSKGFDTLLPGSKAAFEYVTNGSSTLGNLPVDDASDSHLSGVSVEEAVLDRAGLRPRSNSTDGELKLPQRGLCDERKILERYRWTYEMKSEPKGFHNLGNTCFLNSTLQCLAYLPPFCQSLMAMKESNAPKVSGGKKFTNIMRTFFNRIHKTGGNHGGASISPSELVRALPSLGVCGNRNGYKFRPGRQEDAHEFLVHLLDAMHDGELREAGIKPERSGWRDRLPVARLDETTFVHRIFGGYFRSQVQCTSCNFCSNTYDPFLDLSLEISKNNCSSITSALQEFTRKETLDSENRWKCSGCKKRVCATKKLTVFRPPLSLCIQLKRFLYKGRNMFGFGGMGGGSKITKPVEFPANFKLPLSDGRSCAYSLNGIVIHVGGSASSGHYTACVRKPGINGASEWFHMDDSSSQSISEKTVLKQKNAYLLFYCRDEVKLEFPAPPRRSAMSTEEAKELSRTKARANSFNAMDSKSLEKRVTEPAVFSDDVAHKVIFNGKDTKGELVLNDKANLLSKKVRSTEEDYITFSGKSGANPKDISMSNTNLASSSPRSMETNKTKILMPSKPVVLEEPSKPVVLEGKNIIRQAFTSKDSSTNSSLIPSKIPTLSASPNNSAPMTSDNRINREPSRDGENVKVVMGSFLKSRSAAWKPRIPGAEKSEEFSLLGNLPSSKWEDVIESATSNDDVGTQRFALDRTVALQEEERKEKTRKRKMHLDRWDSMIDQGKTKKVKKKGDTTNLQIGNVETNAFQRIQSSVQMMSKGRQKGHFLQEKSKKYKKKFQKRH